MRRWVAVLWHASFSCFAAALYFLFVLPRWWELMGVTSHTLGTVLRIVTGALIGLAALPVVFTLIRTRRPEFRTPLLALRLRTASIALHVLAGVLIIGAAIGEIWLSLDDAGEWLFGVYGAAAAIALLGIFAFYLADIAELPSPPPKPLKPKAQKQRRGRGTKTEDDTNVDVDKTTEADAPSKPAADEDPGEGAPPDADDQAQSEPAEVRAESDKPAADPAVPKESADNDTPTESTNAKLPEDEPAEKAEPTRRRRRRLRGGVAVDD
jgi:hypothetical protein